MDHSNRLTKRRSPYAVAVVLIGWTLLVFGSSVAATQTELTTALVTIAQANTKCLIQTGTMEAEKALSLANRFLDTQKVSQN